MHKELCPGRPRSIDDEQVAELIATALNDKPAAATHWSVRSLAAASGLSPSSVYRYIRLFGLQPHRAKSFKLSNDPFFNEKVRDIVGLYLSPPENALVLCVDEKSQCRALERTQPVLPMGLAYVEGITHDYVRHGTTTLFAALDVANDAVLAQRKRRHRHREFLAFLRHIDQNGRGNEGATVMRGMRGWVVIAIVALMPLAACGSSSSLKWTEDVLLPDGRTR